MLQFGFFALELNAGSDWIKTQKEIEIVLHSCFTGFTEPYTQSIVLPSQYQ